jgi:hypothetical protein
MPIEDMKEFDGRIAPAVREITRTKGDISLFALLLREDAPGKWDLVIAAPWAGERVNENLKDVVAVLKRHVSADDLLNVSRVILTTSSGRSRAFDQSGVFREAGPPVEVRYSQFFGMPIRHALILTSTGESSPKRPK